MISSSQRPLPTQHTTNTRDEHPCHQRDSNPRSQQSSGIFTALLSYCSIYKCTTRECDIICCSQSSQKISNLTRSFQPDVMLQLLTPTPSQSRGSARALTKRQRRRTRKLHNSHLCTVAFIADTIYLCPLRNEPFFNHSDRQNTWTFGFP